MLVIVLGAISLAPFVLIMLTSFVKISVVLSILRNALGTQQVPPNQVVTGLAFVLTIFILTTITPLIMGFVKLLVSLWQAIKPF